ncbi:winged helix-turn-helix domain-containing protein [Nocardioides bruguierae]|uniref:winged helix-turn-helix domain-containing protein n=1 Tax=Nocardioides bruguierae TaxID=2945102 RepID=UPI0020201495|nr:crosslink repair DNA glycosylase YcaQ family protein [Nocardioides bruguierae]MCL8024960.1 winged helix DNA-binding domain-containing protein [Nocardioides bruguierae]
MPPTTQTLSLSQARRVALAAQGFCDPPHATPTMRTLTRTVERTGVLQVDSVNVLERAHYLPLYSRMGPYDRDLLPRAAGRRPRRLVEYWAHVQALMPVELWPVMAHRMAQYRAGRGKWWKDLEDDLIARVRAEVAAAGRPVTARRLEPMLGGGARNRDHWGWNWSEARKALDYLYMGGELAIAGRTSQFEVLYDLPERVLPADVLALPVPSPAEAARTLVLRAARSHGVASVGDLADYYRMRSARGGVETPSAMPPVADVVDSLVAEGELEPVAVEGWTRQAYRAAGSRLPRRVPAATLLSPFDPVVWERDRALRLFDFHYRIEIYTPPDKRVHGYYVLPFLLGEELVARVDLKADRRAGGGGLLLVRSAWAEDGAPGETPDALAAELRRMASWLDLDDVLVEPRGDLAPALTASLAGR